MKRIKKYFFSKRGFTLTEILVVVGIISILMSVAFVGYRSFQRETALDTTVSEVINTLRKAQSLSITVKETNKFGVHFDEANQKYVLFEGDTWNTRNPGSDEEHEIRSELEMYDIVFAETGNDVIFNKITGGTPNFGSLKVNIKANPSNYRTVSVNPEGKIGEYELTEAIPPGSFSLVSPVKGSAESSTLLPSFDWDDSAGIGITYTFWHSSDPSFGAKTEITGILNSHYALQAGQELENYARNYWKVKAVNSSGVETWSREQDWYINVNVSNPPDDFSLLNPTDGYLETNTLTPTFDWEDTTDPDGDPLTYTLQHSINTTFNPKTEITLISNSEYTLNQAEKLANHTANYWRVYAVDIYGASKLCRENYWSVNTDVNFAPDSFSLISPADDEVVTATTPTFDWDDAADPDPGDTVTYTIWYSTDPTFISKTEATGIANSEYTVPGGDPLIDGETYYWKIKAVDNHGAETWSNEQDWNFLVSTNQPPGSFSLLSPGNSETINTLNPTFDWEDSVDPDLGDTVTYTLWVDNNSDFSSLLFERAGLAPSEYSTQTSDGLQDGQTYYWKVKAVDDHGAETWSNEQDWSFNIDITDWYVDQSMPASGSGTSWAEAFRTINEAVNVLTSGDTVHVANGTYLEQINLISSHSGTSGDHTLFIAKTGDTNVVIDGPDSGYGFWLNNADYVDIDGLKIMGARYGVMFYNGADHNIIMNSEIYSNGFYGVYFHSSVGGNNSVEYSKVYDNNYGLLSFGGSNNAIHHVQVYDNNQTGIYVFAVRNYHIYNNTIDGNRHGMLFFLGNPFYSTKSRNNIVTNNTNYGIYVFLPLFGFNNNYNDVWGNGTNYNAWALPHVGPNSISQDPQFVNLGANDFHLQAASPCIDTGDPDPFYNDPDGTRADMGALYWVNPTDWYVDQSVSSSGDGLSWATAFQTINEAVNILDSGDTVHIANGTYTEQINLISSHSGTLSDYTVFLARTGDTNVIIDGPNTSHAVRLNSADYIEFDGINITSAQYGMYFYNNTSNSIIKNGRINDMRYGVYFHSSSGSGNDVDNLEIYKSSYGIYAYQNSNSIYNSKIYDNARYGIRIDKGDVYKVHGNEIHSNGRQGLYAYEGNNIIVNGNAFYKNINQGAYFSGCNFVDFYENKVVDNQSDGLYISRTSEYAIYENEISGNQNYGIYCKEGSAKMYKNNVAKNNSHGIYVYGTSRISLNDNNILDNGLRGFYGSQDSKSDITNNTISGNLSRGIHLSGSIEGEVRDNNIFKNRRQGIYAYDIQNFNIHDNKVHGNSEQGIHTSHGNKLNIYRNQIYGRNIRAGLYVSEAADFYIYNNTIFGNQDEGFYIHGPAGKIVSRNNIMVKNDCGFRVLNGSPDINNNYNNVWGNITDYCSQGSIYQGANSISSDPLFVNPGANDFHLQSLSPCINRGDPDPFYNDPDGSRGDIGALWYEGLISFWHLDNNSGSIAYDSADGNNGAISGASWVPGVSGSALSFNGTDNNVDISNAPNLNPADQISFEARVNLNDQKTAKIVQKGDWDGHGIGQDKWKGWKGGVYIDGDSNHSIDWGGGRPNSGQWYYLVLTYDGAYLRLYVDGHEVNNKSVTGNLRVNSRPASMGSDNANQKFFNGIIDEVGIYSRALESGEILDRYISLAP